MTTADYDDVVRCRTVHHPRRERGVRAERSQRRDGGDELGGRGAGVKSRCRSCDSSTLPVAGSATIAATWGPSAATDSGPARAARRPLAVGSGPPAGPGEHDARAVHPARRDSRDPQGREPRREACGPRRHPAASVNMLIMASVSTSRRVRRTMIYHLKPTLAAECGGARGVVAGEHCGNNGVNHQRRTGANQWTLKF